MIESPQNDKKDLRDDEAKLYELGQEERSIETASHHGFIDASRRTRLASEIEAEETRVLHEKEQLADGSFSVE